MSLSKVASFRQAMARPSIGLILLTMFLSTFAFAQFESTLSLLTKTLNLAQRHNFYVFSYIGFVLTISQGVLVRRLVPKIGEFRMCLIGCLLMTLGLALIGVAGQMGSRPFLYIVLPVSVVGFSAMSPSLQALLSLRSSSTIQGGILGLGQSVSATNSGHCLGCLSPELVPASLAPQSPPRKPTLPMSPAPKIAPKEWPSLGRPSESVSRLGRC